MAYEKNPEYEAGAPKKADVLIRCTQNIALKQDELCEQTKRALARIDEAVELFAKNNNDSTYVVKQSGEIFDRLQSENSALKQELLYLAKQSENIYAGLAEKITEISDQAKGRDDTFNGIADKINDVAEQSVKSVGAYSEIADKLAELSEQNKRNESLITALSDKLEAIYERTRLNEKAYGELSDKIVVSERSAEPAEVDLSQVMSKLNYITEQLKRSEGAHSVLADKFEILSMRVEQFGFESAKPSVPYAHTTVQPVAYPAPVQTVVPTPVQTVVKEEIDYDKLAEKVASLISTREVVSPDYIASKVAEQIVMPEIEAANVNVSVDSDRIARQVADLINVNQPVRVEQTAARVEVDEVAIADRIAQRLEGIKVEATAPVTASVDIDEESLAERIAKKVGGMRAETVVAAAPVAPVAGVQTDIDEEELADRISLKVGSLKSEDFEILVDDNGCSSISKEIADHLDYNAISNIIADKLREALDLAAVNAPDYEEMAERISEKITVAGINEDAIADKAAAVLSNYLPEFDTDEITDKITGAVIDVVSAMPQPTLDSEAICNAISERLIESQEDHDYDIVIDDDGIAKITELVAQEIEKGVATRFDAVDDNIGKITEIVQDTEQTDARFDKVEEELERLSDMLAEKANEERVLAEQHDEAVKEAVESIAVADAREEDYTRLSELLAAEIEKGTAHRFDKVEENIAKLTELVAEPVSDTEDEYEEEYAEDDYTVLSEVVAAEIEKGVASRLDGLEENIAKITEIITAEDEEEYADAEEAEDTEQTEDYDETEDVAEEDYTRLSEAVAAEVGKTLSTRLDGLEENIAKITEIITADVEEQSEDEYAEDENYEVSGEEYDETEDVAEEDYTRLSEAVAAEVERTLTARFESVEQNIARITGLIDINDGEGIDAEKVEENVVNEKFDYDTLSVVVAAQIEKGVTVRLESVDEKVSQISALIDSANEVNERFGKVEEELANISRIVSDDAVFSERFDKLEVAVANIGESKVVYPEAQVENNTNVAVLAAGSDYNEKLDRIENGINKISDMLTAHEDEYEEEYADYTGVEDYSMLSEVVAAEIEKGVAARFDSFDEKIATITELAENASKSGEKLIELVSDGGEYNEDYDADGLYDDYDEVTARFDKLEESIAKITESLLGGNAQETNERLERLEESISRLGENAQTEAVSETNERLERLEESISRLGENAQTEAVSETNERLERLEESIARLGENAQTEAVSETNERLERLEESISRLGENAQTEVVSETNERLERLEESISRLGENAQTEAVSETNERLERLEESIARITENSQNENLGEVNARFDKIEDGIARITETVRLERIAAESANGADGENGAAVGYEALAEVSARFDRLEDSIARMNDAVRMEKLEESIARLSEDVQNRNLAETNERFDKLEESLARINDKVENGTAAAASAENDRLTGLENDLASIKQMLEDGIIAAAANETAAANSAAAEVLPEVEEDEEAELVTVSDIVPETEEIEETEEAEAEEIPVIAVEAPVETDAAKSEEFEEFEEDDEEEDDEDDFMIDALDVDRFGDDELMPGELSDFSGEVDFANMMKFKRSFIARIIQSNDDYKQYYGEVKHALISYRKVNSNVAWGAERFNKGRETIARMKIRGKTLCLYLALDPNEYKTSVYHHLDVSDNKSVAGTPMMVKVKSPLGVRKAIRLIDEMLAKRNGEKREIPERDYAAMYPYETIEELIEDGLVKDVRKK